MLTLNKLQKQFVKNLSESTEDFLQLIESDDITSQQHFDIYKNSISGALQNVLKEIYPVSLKLVGEEFFITMINDYIAITDSVSSDIGDYGNQLPEFISQFTPANSLPYLSDVARLEWAWHSIFTAPENNILNLEKLAMYYETQAENILFLLPPKSTLLSSVFPIHHIWEVNQNDYTGDNTIVLNQDQHYFYLVWRNQTKMRIDVLSFAEWQTLTWIQQKMTLGDIADIIDASEINFSEVLPVLVEKNWLCDFVIRAVVK